MRVINEFFEMILPRRQWKQEIDNLSDCIIQSWCLVHYCTLTGCATMKKHCKIDELQRYLIKCADFKIEGNNTVKERKKVLIEIWNERDFATHINSVNLIINTKFRKEHININNPEYLQCIKDCMLHSNKIISVIANADQNEIISYSNRI